MAFTPYSTPIQYEYKPLNLAAFAVPLGKMQEQLDLTKAAISSTDFDLAHLPYGSDPERAKELIATARAKRDELAKNLMETKNYRQAAIKLNELNKTWKLDPEKSGLESNYKLWQERDKEERERIDNGKANQITRDQYLQWKAKEIRNYEAANEEGKTGAAFKASWEKPEGDYRTVTGSTGRLADLEDELQELSFKAAQAVETDTVESALALIGIDATTMDAHYKKRIVESRSKEKTAEAVRDYLLTQPKYKQWAEEVAHYNHLDMQYSGKYADYAGEIVGSALKDNEQSIKDREAYLKKVKGKKEEDPVYANLLERKDLLSNMKSTGEYDPKVVEKLYTAQHVAGVFNFDALGKLFETRKENTEDVFRTIPKEDDGGGNENGTLTGIGDAFVTPNKFEIFSVGDIDKTIYTNAKTMLPELVKVGNLAGGAARTIFLGQKGSETRIKNSKNPSLYRDRIERGLSIFTDLKNKGITSSTEFYKALNRAGILTTQADAKALWNDWSSENSGSLTLTKNVLQSTSQMAADYQDAKILKTNIAEAAKKSEEAKKLSQEDANVSFKLNVEAINQTNRAKLEKAGAEVKRIAQTGETIINATPLQIAKAGGYKSVQEAVAAGFNFFGQRVFSGKTSTEFYQSLVENNLTKQEISKRLTGNKEIDAYLNNQFLNASDLSTFKPAYGTWDPLIFDEKGNVRPGVTLDVSGKRSAHVNFHGNSTYYEAPVLIKTEDGVIERMAYVVPKTGSQAFTQRILNYATDITQGKQDNLQKQTNDVVRTYSFNNRFKNSLSPQTFESTEVSKSGSIPLLTLSDLAPGVNVYVKKEYPSWKDSEGKYHYGEDPVMHIYINDNIVNDPATGKPYYTTNTNAVKAFLDEMIAK